MRGFRTYMVCFALQSIVAIPSANHVKQVTADMFF